MNTVIIFIISSSLFMSCKKEEAWATLQIELKSCLCFRSSAMELIQASGRRSMWGELPEVADSGMLGNSSLPFMLFVF